MRWWAFNEQQLGESMAEFIDREKREHNLCHNDHTAEKLAEAIIAFLGSPEVARNKMRGDE